MLDALDVESAPGTEYPMYGPRLADRCQ